MLYYTYWNFKIAEVLSSNANMLQSRPKRNGNKYINYILSYIEWYSFNFRLTTHISSQSKQHIVSPVRKRLFRCAKWSFIFFKCDNNALFFCSSFFTSTNFNFEYKFSINVATSLSCTKRLWPPGIFFIIWRSILSFSRIANPLSIKIGGCVASKFVRKSGGGFCMSTVVTYTSNQQVKHIWQIIVVFSCWQFFFSNSIIEGVLCMYDEIKLMIEKVLWVSHEDAFSMT